MIRIKRGVVSNPVSRIVRPLFNHPHARNIFGGIPLLVAMVLTGTAQMPISAFGLANSSVLAYDPSVTLANMPVETKEAVVFPVNPNNGLSQGFNLFHPGIDVMATLGTPIKAARAGMVVYAGYEAFGYGYHVIVDHGNGLQTLYAHMSKILVKTGDTVTNENTLGYVGLTGHTTGPHLHFEVRQDGVRIDPLAFLANH